MQDSRHDQTLMVKNLVIHFHTFDGVAQVLDGVGLEISEGEVVGLVGETGCGKTVTAKAILGVLPTPPARVVSGEILFGSDDLLKLDRRARWAILRKKMKYIPQDSMTSLNPVFTVGQQMIDLLRWYGRPAVGLRVFLPARRSKSLQQKAIQLLDEVHIPSPGEMLRRYPVEFSGGMRQRVLIAMSLIGNPVLLVADEPTTALDVTVQKRVLQLLMDRVREKNLSMLYITHNLGVVRQYCDRVYIMYAGNIVESGKTKELLASPKHPYSRGLIQSFPKLTGTEFKGIPGNVPNYLYPPEGCRFHPRCPYAMPVCEVEKPCRVQIDKMYSVACHPYGEEDEERAQDIAESRATKQTLL